MRSNNTKPIALHSQAGTSAQLFHDWFDPIETGVRDRVRSFIEGMIEAELETALSRPRYSRPTKTRGETDNVPASLSGHRHGHRESSGGAAAEKDSASITSTRRRFMLTAMAAAAYGSVGTQRRAQAAIVQTDTASLPPLPLPAGIRSRYVSNINGLTFHVLEAGFEERGRPCVLLLHGYPELAYGWRKVMLPLASAGFHVLAPDMRGYGRTTGWDDSYDGDVFLFRHTNLVRDALGLVSAFGYRSAAVVGRDAGSPVAAYCLKRASFRAWGSRLSS